nr:reverse transcriptase domain-containing protein [Tanacetum cinerariifolium]
IPVFFNEPLHLEEGDGTSTSGGHFIFFSRAHGIDLTYRDRNSFSQNDIFVSILTYDVNPGLWHTLKEKNYPQRYEYDEQYEDCTCVSYKLSSEKIVMIKQSRVKIQTLSKPIISYPSRLNDQKVREKATNQMEKFFQIVQDLHFDNPVVDFEADPRVPLILGRSFLRTGRALIDVYGEEITLREILGFSNNSSGGNPTSTFKPILSDSSLSLTPFEGSNFILKEIEAYLKDESISPEIDHADCDSEGDICLIEKLLNNDPF